MKPLTSRSLISSRERQTDYFLEYEADYRKYQNSKINCQEQMIMLSEYQDSL